MEVGWGGAGVAILSNILTKLGYMKQNCFTCFKVARVKIRG